MLDIKLARDNMIDNQVRTWDVLDPRVLDTLAGVHREVFVPAAFRYAAFIDMTIPLGHGEVMMKPVVEGRLLQALALTSDDEVLEIGTGSGYLTACMAHLAGYVTSVDIHADFTRHAHAALAAAGVRNARLATADVMHDYEPQKRFDVLVVTGAVPEVPHKFLSWLAPEGRAFVICGHPPAMTALLLTHVGHGRFEHQSLFETDLPWLVGAAPEPQFVL